MLRFATPVAALLCSLLPAQADEILVIQRAADRSGRDQLYAHLQETRVTVNFENLEIAEVARFLREASGNVVNFAVWTKEEIEPLTLRLARTPLTAVMDIAQRFGKIRFVYRKGIVLIQHAREVKEYTSLRLYDVRAATMPIKGYPGPRLGLGRNEEDEVEEEEDAGTSVSGFDTDKLTDLIRSNVLPDSWDAGGVSISAYRGVLWVRQTESGHRKVIEILRQLGALPTPRQVVRRVPATLVPVASRGRG